MSERHVDAATKGDAVLATVALLREATIAIALDDALRGVSSREQRRWGREAREHGKRAWAHVDYESIYFGLARRLLEQCVEHGQAWGAASETIDACLAWQAALTPARKDALAELIPEPIARSAVEGYGVIAPAELDE